MFIRDWGGGGNESQNLVNLYIKQFDKPYFLSTGSISILVHQVHIVSRSVVHP